MSFSAQAVLDRVKTATKDNYVHWIESEWLRYISDTLLEIASAKPEAFSNNASVPLLAGKTKQTLPAGSFALLDIVRNMGANGLTPGKPIRLANREDLDRMVPDWHSKTGQAIRHYTYDRRDPKTFYVSPAPASVMHVEMVSALTPAAIGSSAAQIGLDDIYLPIIVFGALAKAYMKDQSSTVSPQLAQSYYGAFAQAIGIKTDGDKSKSPNPNSVFNPAFPTQAKE